MSPTYFFLALLFFALAHDYWQHRAKSREFQRHFRIGYQRGWTDCDEATREEQQRRAQRIARVASVNVITPREAPLVTSPSDH